MNEQISIKSERESGIELLRIIAMLMIIAHHFTVHGVMHYKTAEQFIRWADGTLLNKAVSVFLLPGGEVGVAVFFMITGFFCINKSKGSLLKVLTQTSVYGILSLIIFFIMKLSNVSYAGLTANWMIEVIRTIVLPGSGGSYWFVSAYVAVVLLIPYMNPHLTKLSRRGFLWVLFFSWLFLYSLAAFFGSPYFTIQKGLFFYCIGAYIRLHFKPKKPAFLWFVWFILGWITAAIIAYAFASIGIIKDQTQTDQIVYRVLVALETSIPVPVCSTSIFMLFKSLNLGSNKMVNSIASTTFGIYLLHDLGIWRGFIWQRIFKTDTLLFYSDRFPLYALLVVISVFIVCSLVDWARQKWIEPVLMKKAENLRSKIDEHIKTA